MEFRSIFCGKTHADSADTQIFADDLDEKGFIGMVGNRLTDFTDYTEAIRMAAPLLHKATSIKDSFRISRLTRLPGVTGLKAANPRLIVNESYGFSVRLFKSVSSISIKEICFIHEIYFNLWNPFNPWNPFQSASLPRERSDPYYLWEICVSAESA